MPHLATPTNPCFFAAAGSGLALAGPPADAASSDQIITATHRRENTMARMTPVTMNVRSINVTSLSLNSTAFISFLLLQKIRGQIGYLPVERQARGAGHFSGEFREPRAQMLRQKFPLRLEALLRHRHVFLPARPRLALDEPLHQFKFDRHVVRDERLIADGKSHGLDESPDGGGLRTPQQRRLAGRRRMNRLVRRNMRPQAEKKAGELDRSEERRVGKEGRSRWSP